MKCLLLFVLMGLTHGLHAQTTDTKTHLPGKITIRDYSTKNGFSAKLDTTIFVPYPQARVLHTRKPGVYKLSLDGMPCIVPDVTGIVQMPNAMSQQPAVAVGKISNGAERLRLERLKGLMNNFKTQPSR